MPKATRARTLQCGLLATSYHFFPLTRGLALVLGYLCALSGIFFINAFTLLFNSFQCKLFEKLATILCRKLKVFSSANVCLCALLLVVSNLQSYTLYYGRYVKTCVLMIS